MFNFDMTKLMRREAPYRGFIKVFLHFPTVLQGTVPFPLNKVLILKDKIHRTLSVHAVKKIYTRLSIHE